MADSVPSSARRTSSNESLSSESLSSESLSSESLSSESLSSEVAPSEAISMETASIVQSLKESAEPRPFTVVRRADESGVSGTGRVLDGCVFHNGQVVVCWRGDINSEKSGYASLAIYPCWEAFQRVHIDSHPGNETEVVFGADARLLQHITDRAAESG